MWAALLTAGRFLTRLPWPDPGPVTEATAGRAALFYPLIGLVIGVMLWGLAALLPWAPVGVAAALILVLWVWLTGALHLDGLSDTADAWVGGLGSRERALEIMRDPRAGAMGVVAIVLVLLVKWSALMALLATGSVWMLVWIPVLARVQILSLMLTVPYARPVGMASAAVAHLPRRAAWVVVAAVILAVPWIGGVAGLVALMVALLILLAWRRALLRRLGGFTGDTAGALVELTEAAVLIGVILLLSAP